MALINCSECGYELSDQAEECPQCGCPNAPGGMTPISMPPEPKHKKRIPPEVRRVLKSAAPFAGIALGWYLFMPNFMMLTQLGIYRSQVAVDLMPIYSAFRRWRYETFTSQEYQDWNECRLRDAPSTYEKRAYGTLDPVTGISLAEPDPTFKKIDYADYVKEYCGEEPTD